MKTWSCREKGLWKRHWGKEALATVQEMREGRGGREGKPRLGWLRRAPDKLSPVEHLSFGNGKSFIGGDKEESGKSMIVMTRSMFKTIIF